MAASTKNVVQKQRRQSKYEKPINAIWQLFSDYSNASTIHGVRYLGEPHRHWTERIWWLIAFAVSLLVCGHLIRDTWLKWHRFPVIVTFAEKSTPIWEIPFPSVTICAETKVKQSVFNYTLFCNALNEQQSAFQMNETQRNTFRSAAELCRLLPLNMTLFDEPYARPELIQQLQMLSPSMPEVMYACEWQGQKKSCNKVFDDVWTDEGLCFTFNYVDTFDFVVDAGATERNHSTNAMHSYAPQNWSIHSGYTTATALSYEQHVYPRRVFGASDGLTVHLRLFDRDIDYLCGGPVTGFKLLLHTPGEWPQISKYFYRIPLDHEVIVSVKPHMMKTSERLGAYDAARRQCFFESERRLRFFRMYTQRNCELECIANATLRRCGCTSFAMPKTTSTQTCGLAKRKCYADVELKVSRRQAGGGAVRCNCLPACSSIAYDAELSFAKYDLRKFYRAQRKSFVIRRQYARIFISFKDNQFFASRRSELYGRADFMANCGGLLGLFMGFSLLSLVEMIYHCTLRLACNLRQRSLCKRTRATRTMTVDHE